METTPLNIDWKSKKSILLMNPRYAEEDQLLFRKILDQSPWEGHVWLATSGSSAKKWAALSKKAILASAQAVNEHIQSSASDIWMHTLPDFHVGGVGIWARSYLSGAHVHDFKKESPKWQAVQFCQATERMEGTLAALVPAQVYDLVQFRLTAPQSLRAVIIGGGALSPEIYQRAVELGWPLLPSYGLTECASQVATASLGSWKEGRMPHLHLLGHVEAKEEADGRLCFKGASLLTVYAYWEGKELQWVDPKQEGWYRSDDRGKVEGPWIEIRGRIDEMVKVGGESVDIGKLEAILQEIRLQLQIDQGDMALVAVVDERLGHAVHLATAQMPSEQLEFFLEAFQKKVLPFERIRTVHELSYIPRSHLGKLMKRELLALINS